MWDGDEMFAKLLKHISLDFCIELSFHSHNIPPAPFHFGRMDPPPGEYHWPWPDMTYGMPISSTRVGLVPSYVDIYGLKCLLSTIERGRHLLLVFSSTNMIRRQTKIVGR